MDESHRETLIPHLRATGKNEIEELFDIFQTLGKGSFGTVKLVYEKETKLPYAMKMVNKERGNKAYIEQVVKEVEIMKKLSHPHIVKLHSVFETPKKLYLFMEYCKGGELVKKIKERKYCSEQDARIIISKIISAIAYLHKMGIVHRDIKPNNILLYDDNPEDPYNIRVSDFGLATFTEASSMMDNVCGTPLYMAPEVVANLGYSHTCDIWSIGVLMYLLLTGYTQEAEETLMKTIDEGEVAYPDRLFSKVSEPAKNLMSSMLQLDPAHRLSAGEILSHPWITGDSSINPSIPTVLDMMKSYNAERRLKKAMHVVLAALFFKKPLKSRIAAIEVSSIGTLTHDSGDLGTASLKINQGPDDGREIEDDNILIPIDQCRKVEDDGARNDNDNSNLNTDLGIIWATNTRFLPALKPTEPKKGPPGITPIRRYTVGGEPPEVAHSSFLSPTTTCYTPPLMRSQLTTLQFQSPPHSLESSQNSTTSFRIRNRSKSKEFDSQISGKLSSPVPPSILQQHSIGVAKPPGVTISLHPHATDGTAEPLTSNLLQPTSFSRPKSHRRSTFDGPTSILSSGISQPSPPPVNGGSILASKSFHVSTTAHVQIEALPVLSNRGKEGHSVLINAPGVLDLSMGSKRKMLTIPSANEGTNSPSTMHLHLVSNPSMLTIPGSVQGAGDGGKSQAQTSHQTHMVGDLCFILPNNPNAEGGEGLSFSNPTSPTPRPQSGHRRRKSNEERAEMSREMLIRNHSAYSALSGIRNNESELMPTRPSSSKGPHLS